MSRRPAAVRALTRLQYREAILISIAMAVVAAVGWLVTPFWLAVAVAAQLAIGGIGAVWLIGPARIGARLRALRDAGDGGRRRSPCSAGCWCPASGCC